MEPTATPIAVDILAWLAPKLEGAFQIPPAFDYGATIAWALSGGLIAARRGYDVAGIAAIAMVSATGGGLLRDGLFLQDGPPLVVRSPVYIVLVLLAATFVLVFGARMRAFRHFNITVDMIDAVGLGAYAVIGTQLALAAGLGVFGAGLVGVVNSVGGGVLRNVLMGREPDVFRPGAFMATASLLGVVLYLFLTVFVGAEQALSGWIIVAVVFIIRVLSLRYNLTTTPARGFSTPSADEAAPATAQDGDTPKAP